MALPAEYLAVLERLALAFTSYKERNGHSAVLVGGAAAASTLSALFFRSTLTWWRVPTRRLRQL